MGGHLESTKVGVQEFRENLTHFLESKETVAITRDGETVGFFIPARKPLTEAWRKSMQELGEQIQAQMKAAGVTEEELVADFEAERLRSRRNAS